jgi:hypothetical protein
MIAPQHGNVTLLVGKFALARVLKITPTVVKGPSYELSGMEFNECIGLLSPGVNAFADCFQKASAINVLKLRVEAVSSRIFVDTGILFELSGQHRHVVRRNSL